MGFWWNDSTDQPRWLAWILVVIVVLILLGPGLWALGVWTAPWYGEGEARRQIQGDADFRIAAYDHFFDLCASAQADGDRIVNLEAELADPATTASRAAQVRASLTAIRNQRDATVRTYNADASQDYTVGQFRDSDLPFPLTIPTEGTLTCNA